MAMVLVVPLLCLVLLADRIGASFYINIASVYMVRALNGSLTYQLQIADPRALGEAGRWFEGSRHFLPYDDRRASRLLALYSLAIGNTNLAAEYWALADTYTELLLRGDYAMEADSVSAGLDWFSMAARIKPDSSPAWCSLAKNYTNLHEALEFARLSVSLDANWRSAQERAGCWLFLAEQSFLVGDHSESLRAFEVVTDNGGDVLPPRAVSDAFLLQGVLRRLLGASLQSVQPLYIRGLDVDPRNPSAWIRYAQNTYLMDRSYGSMMESFRTALALEPDNVNVAVDIITFLVSEGLMDGVREICALTSPSVAGNPEVGRFCGSQH